MPSLTYGVGVRRSEQPLRVGLVLGEQQLAPRPRRRGSARRASGASAAITPPAAPSCRSAGRGAVGRPTTRCCGTRASAARAASPARARGSRTVIRIEDVLGRGLGVLDEDVEVAVLVEDAGVEQLVLELAARAAGGWSSTRSSYGIRRLRVLVEILHVRVRRRAVEVEVVLLDVLAVVALAVGQAEQPLLEDRVLAVPEREREAEPLLVVGDAGEAVLAPAIGARARLVVA